MKRICVLLSLILIFTSSITVFGESNPNFSDVGSDHWAYESIMKMSQLGIINGFNDGTFRPDAEITRAEFAKMMILTLNLDSLNKANPSFEDVGKNHWAYGYIEGSKFYMTGYKISGKDYFKPDEPALREDLAVALVKALEEESIYNFESILSNFEDKNEISDNLKPYMAKAVEIGLFTGEEIDDLKYLNPMAPISRAETATLLSRLLPDNNTEEEKVTYDEEKIVFDDNNNDTSTTGEKTPKLKSVETEDGKAELEWTKVSSKGFKYYKVVLSKNDSTPIYPDNGYAKSIANVNTDEAYIRLGSSYQDGDFGPIITEGVYYVSITAVYEDASYPSNVRILSLKKDDDQDEYDDDKYDDHDEYDDDDKYNGFPNNISIKTPELIIKDNDDDEIEIKWTPVSSDNFTYYKIVISKENSSPEYPDDGYLTYINNPNKTDFEIELYQKYNGGDFGGILLPGKYYVTITAVYEDGKYTSNTVRINLEDD